VERQREEIEIDDGVETLGKIVEEDGEVALLGDGFADFEEGFELAAGVLVGEVGGGSVVGRGFVYRVACRFD
jgi:hypothetical protein